MNITIYISQKSRHTTCFSLPHNGNPQFSPIPDLGDNPPCFLQPTDLFVKPCALIFCLHLVSSNFIQALLTQASNEKQPRKGSEVSICQ